ncbi:hypothetical protein [Planococcus sp. CAU13]|uniref:hypothetical protein n=1 Tax=Planococcus sp. CAU13 TaxID=1541197 RepID=UPI00052FE503|nr:hypothetical protein [Planococcus sp. CAU13]
MTKKQEAVAALKKKMELLHKIQKVRQDSEIEVRVELPKFDRSTEWREELENLGALQIIDRGETIGVLLEPEIFQAFLEYLNLVEHELEEAVLAAILEQRKDDTNFLSGEELTTAALKIFEERKKEIRRFLDDN